MCDLAPGYCCFVWAKVDSCSAGNFPSKGMNATSPWEMAQGRGVAPVPRENQSLCASEAQTPMKWGFSWLLEEKKSTHRSVFSSALWENVVYEGILCLFSLLPLANTFSTPGVISTKFDRDISGIINFLSV